MEDLGRRRPPTGLARLLFRIPVRLCRMGLGRLLGGRFLLINHVGRVSGRMRQVVVEVVEHDARDGSYVVASGFGPNADWYRNVLRTPQVTVQVRGRTFPATAVALPAEEGAELMARYAPRHPVAARQLARFMGFAVYGSAADYREVGRRIPFLRFTPR
ncbi:deazaflavin-dependent oxidoreductase (nitroreductase family) [Saccharopolyspora erythraea NRRL 2338]|uniref:Uncharacterized protein n=2 Tax=Saccharopolyspora erythraea TaxID=1836 RepID=A4FGZ4_SACEN|nr:nitroreductase family deazaflavin-dependent oxidoreductase [Saccharopolyspora erythraea]EQD81835.1 nitroreductase [Saccharopolyspora erythraea D]PFG97024.1 deazaflavin-dependent oxidoreductase (nitroreductase family) [Saccharopolyspora erythraea NRRL 2338]QRK87232.1 nitroreductase family deazaflavin-dependent oxidoreductase [Saccharopolyspora erythraea]CAM03319.1 hypothetical protein SACE_4048 [Saccharopolyspora erythraea NRRL 2338]